MKLTQNKFNQKLNDGWEIMYTEFEDHHYIAYSILNHNNGKRFVAVVKKQGGDN